MLKIYLAHHSEYRKEIREWQKKVEKLYNIIFNNPFYRNKQEIERWKQMEKNNNFDSIKLSKSEHIELVAEDFNLIFYDSEWVFAYIKDASIGTSMEILFTALIANKPIYIATNKYYHHPFLRFCIYVTGGKMFKTKEGFLKFLTSRGLKNEM